MRHLTTKMVSQLLWRLVKSQAMGQYRFLHKQSCWTAQSGLGWISLGVCATTRYLQWRSSLLYRAQYSGTVWGKKSDKLPKHWRYCIRAKEVLLLRSIASETWNIKGNTAPTHSPQSVSYTWLTVWTVLLHRWLPSGYLYCLCWVILCMFRCNTNWFCLSVLEVKRRSLITAGTCLSRTNCGRDKRLMILRKCEAEGWD